MSLKRDQVGLSSIQSGSKRYHAYDSARVNDILSLMHDELSLLNKVMYVQRNQHRRTRYYKSMENVIRYCQKVELYLKDVLDHLKTYEEVVIVDGLLQVCCLIYKTIMQSKNCAKYNGNQVSYRYFIPLCSTLLAGSCRIIELNLLLLKEVLPLQQKYMSNNPIQYKEYLVPQSVVSLLHIKSAKELGVDYDDIPIMDEELVAN